MMEIDSFPLPYFFTNTVAPTIFSQTQFVEMRL